MKFRHLLPLLVLAAAGPLAAADRALVFEPAQSTLDIVVKATVDSFTGRLAAYDLAGRVDEQGRITAANFAFHFRDVLTGKPKRDKAMHEWQHTDQFPDGSFSLVSLVTEGDTTRAFGRLTLHGVTREVNFPVTVTHSGATYAIEGDAPVDTREFGLPVIRLLGLLKVDPVVHVRFHFQGKAA